VSAPPTGPVRVLLCDDAADLRGLVRAALERGPEPLRVVAEAGDGETAVRLLAEGRPEVVVLDLDMPGPPAAAVLRALADGDPGAAIVTYSGHDLRAAVGSDAARIVAAHMPKTTDLAVVRETVHEIGMRRRAILHA
jgi:DNA-binding NarL/FixJ family response regulator